MTARTPSAGRGAPAYAEIEVALTEEISSGRLKAGDRLAPERELAAQFGVSRMTLRNALGSLERRGLIIRAVGRHGGTFVAEPKLRRDLSRYTGLSDQLRRQGIAAGARVVSAVERSAGPAVAATLAVEPGAIVYEIVRTRLAGGRPVAFECSTFPAAHFPDLLRHPLDGSLYELMRSEYDEAPHRAMEYLELVPAGPEEARELEVAEGSPLMFIERIAYGESGTPLELSREHFRGDRTRMVIWSSDPR